MPKSLPPLLESQHWLALLLRPPCLTIATRCWVSLARLGHATRFQRPVRSPHPRLSLFVAAAAIGEKTRRRGVVTTNGAARIEVSGEGLRQPSAAWTPRSEAPGMDSRRLPQPSLDTPIRGGTRTTCASDAPSQTRQSAAPPRHNRQRWPPAKCGPVHDRDSRPPRRHEPGTSPAAPSRAAPRTVRA